ncbi:chemotaxis-specific protein-glutamate methyltransferase CheB [Rhodothermus profundi]|uniref:Protein-glutamate methylesterase/protein-glutamine glutaminase n=1 Tax=Rhodothermus profundi TaxID=633813 RepID=A0A1M6PYI9_9BACT|nr:chemotaxis-specific protein-glutamate methyltransferase CheB [Rhodothermus profundi]SHK12971.1 two-component system, chemotaxis family, response regulator CheB [Rhodothermus profundi]
MIRLLIVDDSALMRRQLTRLFEEAGGFEIRTARDGTEAIELNRSFEPDVITLDIHMPRMDGLTALAHIMAERPVPVVMFSSLTQEGALATFEALNLGAVDYVAKPGGTITLSLEAVREELIAKVRAAATARLRRRKPQATVGTGVQKASPSVTTPVRPARTRTRPAKEQGVVLIGVSTGGPATLEEILPKLPADFPWPVLVAQHMPAAFTGPFAQRLDRLCAVHVVEVARPMPLEAGTVYIGKGEADLVISRRGTQLIALARPAHPDYLWHPSVELLGRSALRYVEPRQIVAVMLTGMGYDGADAFTEIRRQGGRVIAESERSAVVFGMPAEVIKRGGATKILPAEKIADQLIRWIQPAGRHGVEEVQPDVVLSSRNR